MIHKAARDLADAKNVVALTGAGISVESGIPPFRGKGGVWETFDPMEYAHIDAFIKDPAKVWNVLIKGMKEIIDTARPNNAHNGLARLEEWGILKTIITQNVDGLHQKAGSVIVYEVHGNINRFSCLGCGASYTKNQIYKKLKTESVPIYYLTMEIHSSGQRHCFPSFVSTAIRFEFFRMGRTTLAI